MIWNRTIGQWREYVRLCDDGELKEVWSDVQRVYRLDARDCYANPSNPMLREEHNETLRLVSIIWTEIDTRRRACLDCNEKYGA